MRPKDVESLMKQLSRASSTIKREYPEFHEAAYGVSSSALGRRASGHSDPTGKAVVEPDVVRRKMEMADHLIRSAVSNLEKASGIVVMSYRARDVIGLPNPPLEVHPQESEDIKKRNTSRRARTGA